MPKRKVVKHCRICDCLFMCFNKECVGWATNIKCYCNEHTRMNKERKAKCGIIVIRSGKE